MWHPGARLLALLLILCSSLPRDHAFRVLVGSNRTGKYPRPFDQLPQAFVGIFGDPQNYQRERINEGALDAADKELLYEDVSPRQSCPGMVGPFSDGSYYCGAREFGYCDRRSGTCFCNAGYADIDCGKCQDSHYRVGPHCHPKKLCPDDCSGAGTCNYNNGTCSCLPHRYGERCQELLCSFHSTLCLSCTADVCLQCAGGYYLTGDSSVCRTCYDFDPRCAGCIKEEGCTVCADSTLTSVRRSGYRMSDIQLPEEEVTREFSITLPFGTKSPESFAEAESYFVASNSSSPLKNSAKTCSQGLNNDSSWSCTPSLQSHIVCGHYGVFKFTYPNYEVREDSNYIRLYVQRSGGGYGDVTINYYIKHYTTNDSDVVATAPYTTVQQLRFAHGVVENSFLITILDDNLVEENEVFQVVLETPEGGGSVGAQFRTNVTIVDDDLYKTSPTLSYAFTDVTSASISRNTTRARAGADVMIQIQSVLPNGVHQMLGGDRYLAVIENTVASFGQRASQRIAMNVTSMGNGVYQAVALGGVLTQGSYDVHMYYAMPNSIQGEYFYDAWFDNLAVRRVDHNVNFTWGTGRLIPRGSDYISVRWRGGVVIDTAGYYSFGLDADDSGRLWVDGTLLLDHMHERQLFRETGRSIFLRAGIAEIVLEYIEMNGEAYAHLRYAPSGQALGVIPQHALVTLYPVGNSPFNLDILSDFTSTATTEASGDGLHTALALVPQTFEVCPRDRYGNLRDDEVDPFTLPLDAFYAVLQHLSRPEVLVHPTLTYNVRTHCFDGTYTIYAAGLYQLNITFGEDSGSGTPHIYGSPFTVAGLPSEPSAPLSVIVGVDPTQPLYVEAGDCITYRVDLRDGAGNPILTGGESIVTYAFRVNHHSFALGVGPSNLSHIYSGTNFPTMTPSINPTQQPSTFLGAFTFASPPRAPDTPHGTDVVRYGEVTDLANGSYSGYVCPVIAGRYELHVLLRGKGASNQMFRTMDAFYSTLLPLGRGVYQGMYIGSSPFDVEVFHTKASALTSQVVGDGLRVGTTGVPSYVMLTLRDPYDNVYVNKRLTDGSAFATAPVSITFTVDQTPLIYTDLWDYTNGSFLLKYVPELLGNQTLSIFVDGGHVRGSPFSVAVASGVVDEGSSFAVGEGLHTATTGLEARFFVYAFDSFDNRRAGWDNFTFVYTHGVQVVTATMLPCTEATVPRCPSLYSSEPGYYYGTYVPVFTGEGQLSIFNVAAHGLRREISNSPFSVVVSPSRPKATSTDVIGNLYSKEAGTLGRVELHLRDYFGNRLNYGGFRVELELLGVAGEWGTVRPFTPSQGLADNFNYKGFFVYPSFPSTGVVDHSDGTYTLTYNVTRTGEYVLRLGLQEQGLNATFFNDTHFGALVDHIDTYTSFPVGGLYMENYVDSLRGAERPFAGTRHWTGDLGGALQNTTQGRNSFIDKYASIYAATAHVAPRDYLFLPSLAGPHATNFRQHHYSILFEGFLRAKTAELYKIHLRLDAGSAAVVFINGTMVVNSTVLQPVSLGTFNFSDHSGQPQILRIEFQHFTGDASMTVAWESISVPLEPIPASAYSHSVNISHYNTTIVPTTHCPACSTAFGALRTATVGYDHDIFVYTRDLFGNLLQGSRGLDVHMYALTVDGPVMRGTVRDLGNSTYWLRYYPTRSGVYEMYVFTFAGIPPDDSMGSAAYLQAIRPHLIQGAPFFLEVRSDSVFIERCAASGRGTVGGIAGDALSFSLPFVDRFNNPTEAENVRVRVLLVDATTSDVMSPATLNVTVLRNRVDCTYLLQRAGSYMLSVELATGDDVFKAVLGSPFAVTVAPSVPVAHNALVRGTGARQAVVGLSSYFFLQSRDGFANYLTTGGVQWFVRLVGDANFSTAALTVTPQCQDLADGQFKCQYVPQYAGTHLLVVKMLRPVYQSSGTLMSRPGGAGLRARYYGSADGADAAGPDVVAAQVDPVIVFSWTSGHIVGADAAYAATGQSVRWEGYLVAPRTDSFYLYARSDLNVTVTLDGEPVFDSLHVVGPRAVRLQQGSAYALTIVASARPHLRDDAALTLLWRTDIYPEQAVPQFYLYDEAQEVVHSPFPVTVQ